VVVKALSTGVAGVVEPHSMQFRPPAFAMVGGRRLAYEETAPAAPEGTVLLLGGFVALELALRHPEAVDRLALCVTSACRRAGLPGGLTR
jgi:hypothetical protein